MLSRTTRPAALGASVALSAGLLLAAGAPSAGATEQPSVVGLAASAYGSTVDVGSVTSGRTALFSACSTRAGATYGSNVAVTDLGRVAKIGAAVTSGSRTGNTIKVTSTTGATSLLGGLVKVTAVTSTSSSSLSGSTLGSSGSTVVTGLTIAGQTRTVPAGVGARIDVAGVATLTFNQQTTTSTASSRQLTVDALRVDLLKDNRLGLPAGRVVIGSATSGASRPTAFAAGGQAYGSTVDVGTLVAAGPSAYVGMPCGGTGGTVRKNTLLGLSVPGVVKAATVASTGQSVERTGSTTATFGSTVAGIDLLGGAVTADAVTVRASTTRTAAGVSSTDDGTVISNLKVLGTPVTVTARANSTVDVAGVGTLTVRKTVKQATGLDVVGLELKLSADRLGVRAGTVVQVAVAKSRVATA